MSYSVYLKSEPCAHCGRVGDEPDCPDPTYNLTPIFDLALTNEPLPNQEVGEVGVVLFGHKTDRPRGLRLLSGRKGRDTVSQLATALANLRDPLKRASFVALEPENKWGDLPGAASVIEQLLSLATEFPDNTWEVY